MRTPILTARRKDLRTQTKAEVRLDIQALRALAVILVVLYHLWPTQLTGGFVGVDVFLVISGFLITAHLVRGFGSSGRLTLSEFYVKRMRRLLPASLSVLGVVAIAIVSVVPQTLWGPVGWQLLASAFYFQNWALASEAVDYLAAGTNPSPVQHYWSLSVEEQFYLVWPLLILGLLWASKLRGPSKAAFLLLPGVALATVLSLAYSIYITNADPQAAYFVTPARIWEFGIGATLALTVPGMKRLPKVRALLSWAGLAAIVGSALFFSGATPFPGTAALLPTLGAAAVIAAGASPSRIAPTRLFALRPVQFAGDISYSLYLWHWPLIVLLPTAVFGPGSVLNTGLRLAIIGLSVILAWLTKVYIEDRFRHETPSATLPKPTRFRPRRAGTAMALALCMVVVGGTGGAIAGVSAVKSETAWSELEAIQAATPECFGAAVSLTGCTPSLQGIYPDPIIANRDAELQGCQQRSNKTKPIVCKYGSADPASVRIALVGDSHANQWLPALKAIADEKDWALTTYLKSGCAFNTAIDLSDSCTEWNREVREELTRGNFDLVVTANTSITKFKGGFDGAVSGFTSAWQPIIDSGGKVLAVADVPRPARGGLPHPPSCVESQDISECKFNLADALSVDAKEKAASNSDASKYVNLNRLICPDGICMSVIGNVLVYRDNNHVTATWARSLAPALGDEMQAALDG